jgi:homoserine dehydrogenase
MSAPLCLDLILVGFGHVARRFVRLLDEQRGRLADHGLSWRVTGIATRCHGAVYEPAGLDVARALAIVEGGGSLKTVVADGGRALDGVLDVIGESAGPQSGAHPRVVVEATVLDINSGQPAIEHIRAALASGAHVVSANKGPIAFAYRDLAALAASADRDLLFEGVVMDGIPVFNLVRETLPAVRVIGFRGIINSTTHHILTAMESGREFGDALAEMQAQGIAEADASMDVDGWDAAAKTAALINVLMNGDVTPRDIDRTGIAGVTGADVRAAEGRGQRLRLVASARLEGDRAIGRVAPTLIAGDDLLARLTGAQNAIVLDTDVLGELAVVQLDSGLTQTAYALLSDLVTIGRRAGVGGGRR